jgi:glutamate synthase (NADPH/NADH) small chain
MDCGVPFCQSGMTIKGMTSGCPLNNLIPEWNDLVYTGNWEQAYNRLHKTSNFPEFTSRVCPALCEKACTCGLLGDAVCTKENEKAIIEYAYANGLAGPKPPKVRTGKRVAVIGSGPAGLAVADQLNTRGHAVTVYERSDRIGGLLRYGIPNMKLEKHIIDRKLDVMKAEGVEFVTEANVGANIKAKKLMEEFDAVVLACGASNPRDINAPGRDANGIYFAVDFLTSTTKSLLDSNLQDKKYISAKDKNVVVIGGGDTGNDCVGTCIRHGCKSVTQLEMMPKAPDERTESNPWPQWPLVCKTDYGQEEAIAVFGHDPRIYTTTVKEFKKDKKGNLEKLVIVSLESKTDEKTGRRMMVPVEGTEKEIPCEMVLIAAGFLGAQKYVADAFGVELNERTNVKTQADSFATNAAGIFTAGDMHTGQSLVVKAIRQGRDCAREVDKYLMGYTNL